MPRVREAIKKTFRQNWDILSTGVRGGEGWGGGWWETINVPTLYKNECPSCI